MRVAVDASSLLTLHPRGEGKSLLRLYEEIAKLRTHWSFVFIGERMSDSARLIKERIPRSEIYVIDVPGYRWNLWENLGLPFAAWRNRAQVLHCASSGTPFWSPLPIVMTVHDVIPLIMDDGHTQANVARFRSRLGAGIRRAAKIITVSENTRDDLIRLMRPNPTKLEVIHWGTDPSSHAPPEHGRPRNLVLGFGGGSTRKNTLNLIRMFAKVAKHRPSAELIILGVSDPTQQLQLRSLMTELGLQNNAKLLGYVPDAELEVYYQNAACLAYVSLYEGFGLPIVEAMAKGIPVVASDRSSIPEVVGDAGLLVDPENIEEGAEAIIMLLADEALHNKLSHNAWQRARQFSWTATAEKTASALESARAS